MNSFKTRRLKKASVAIFMVLCFLVNTVRPYAQEKMVLTGEEIQSKEETELPADSNAVSGPAVQLKNESGTDYFIDSEGGLDNNDGLTEKTPWQSLERVNLAQFEPGDRLLFKKGCSWIGQLKPQGSGIEGKPIIIASYGEGARPLIQGNNIIGDTGDDLENKIFNAAIFFYNQEYWEITDLEVTNRIPGDNPEDHIKKYGILIMGHDAGTLRHMYCRNLYVHDIVSHPVGNQAGIGRGGIAYIIRGNTVETRWDDIIVEDSQIGPRINHYGITFLSTWGSSLFEEESGIPGNEGAGKRVNSTNLIIRNNYCVDIGNAAICPVAYENALIENNVCDTCNSGPNGNVPIWWENGDYTVAQKNEVFNSGATAGKEDSQAFDADVSAKVNYMQYNYTHDNPSGAYFECALGTQYTTHIRYNISQNDGAGKNRYGQGAFVTLGGNSGNAASKMYVYNNSVYFGDFEGKPCESYILHGWGEGDVFNPTNPESFQFKNNIIINDGNSSGYSSCLQGGVMKPYLSGIFSNNAYGGANAAQIKPVTDPSNPMYRKEDNSLVYGEAGNNDPYFGITAPGTGQSSSMDANEIGTIRDIRELASGYRIKEDSPLIGKGTVIPANGGQDYFGNPVSTAGAPNIGADNSYAELKDEEPAEGVTVLDFENTLLENGQNTPFENMQEHCNFGSGIWNAGKTEEFGTELYANNYTTDQQVCKISIPDSKIFKGFTARSSSMANIEVIAGSQSKKYSVYQEKKVYNTDFTEPAGEIYFIISSPNGASDIKFDNLVLANLEGGIKNVALNKPATASGTSQSSKPAANANDGDESTLWVRNMYISTTPPHWWQVDLQQEYDISGMEIAFESALSESEHNWQYKIEGSREETFANPIMLSDQTKTTSHEKKQTLASESNQQVRYVRITLTQLGGDDDPWPAIAEMKVLADITPYKNIALNKTASVNRGSNAARGNDGSVQAGTGAGNVDLKSGPLEWEVDFGKNEKITKTEIVFPDKDKNAPVGWVPNWGYKIEYFNESSQWETLADYTNAPDSNPNKGTPVQFESFGPTGIICSKMKVTIVKAPTTQPGAWALLTEFRALTPMDISSSVDATEPGQVIDENLFYGKPVITSNQAENSEAVTDGTDSTGLLVGNNSWLQIDLGKPYNMNKIQLTYDNADLEKKYQVFVSVDKKQWTPAVDLSSNADNAAVQEKELSAIGRYMKLSFDGAEQNLLECKAYGTEAKTAKKKIMVIVPHEDDELLIGGGILNAAAKNGDEVKVVIGTNGDYNGIQSGKNRIAESMAALAKLNVQKKDILFLGYADNGGLAGVQPITDSQLYKMYMEKDENKVIKGRNGYETYGRDDKQDYHYEYTGEHAMYTKKNFTDDLTHAIEEFNPTDIYVTSMYDMHYDHSYINLFVRKVILDIQDKNVTFKPTLYDGIVHSVAGDSSAAGQGTRWPLILENAALPFSKPTNLEEHTNFEWNKRVSVTVPYQMRQTEQFDYSLKNQALKKYTSQYYNFIGSFSKRDEVFWEKPYQSISYQAAVTASSQRSSDKTAEDNSARKVVDGIESGAIPAMEVHAGHPGFPHAEWVTNGEKENAWVKLSWDTAQEIDRIVLYDRPDPSENITGGKLVFSDGTSIPLADALPANGRAYEITFEPKVTTSVQLVVTQVSDTTKDVGLAEFEVYGVRKDINKKPLMDLIAEADALKNDGSLYTAENFVLLQKELLKAKEQLQTALTDEDILEAAKELQNSMTTLLKGSGGGSGGSGSGGSDSGNSGGAVPSVPGGAGSGTNTEEEANTEDKTTIQKETVKDPATGEVLEEKTVTERTDRLTNAKVVTKVVKDAAGSVISGVSTIYPSPASKNRSNGQPYFTVAIPDQAVNASIKDGANKISIQVLPEQLLIPVNSKDIALEFVIPNSILENKKVDIFNIGITKDVIEAAKRSQFDVTVTIKNSDGKECYSWKMKGKELLNSKIPVTDMNFSLEVQQASQVTAVNKVLKNKGNKSEGLVFQFNQTGSLPAAADVKVFVGDKKNIKSGKVMNLYYYNEKSKKLEELDKNKYTVGKTGYITVKITHCSNYVLLPAKETSKSVVSLFDKVKVGTAYSIEKGKTFSLKITNTSGAVIKKVMTSTNPGVAAVDKNGKITAKAKGTAEIQTKITVNNQSKVFKTKITVK